MEPRSIDRRAIPPGARFTEWRAPDGWAYRGLDWPQPEGAEARGSLLFAGGRGDFIEKYFEAYHHWHSGGWNVAAFDWRSQGGSRGDIKGGHLDTLDILVDDLDALLAAWMGARPGPRAAVGHSMGGHVLLRTLAERKPGLDAAVLVAPMIAINNGPLPPFAAHWAAQAMRLAGLGRLPAWRSSVPPPPAGSLRQSCLTGCPERYADELWWWEKEPGYSLGAPSWGWLGAAYRSCAALTDERLARVEPPVLLVGTDADRLVSPAAIRRAAAALPGAELLMFPSAGHEILRETDAVRLAAFARIDEFLARRAPR
jgi:lysophospholipase